MKKLIKLLCGCIIYLLAVQAYSQDVDEIVNKYINAIGGMDKLKALKSIRMKGKALMQDVEAPLTLIIKRPKFIRMEITIQGKTMVQAYDGEIAWRIVPFMGKAEPEKMPQREAEYIEERADIEGPLVNYKEKGNKVELVGKEEVQGTDAYKLKVTMKNDKVKYIYLDAEEYLILKQTTKEKHQDTEIEIDSYLSNYKLVGGVLFPHFIEIKVKDSTVEQITIESIEINPEVDEAIFKMGEAVNR